MLDDNLVFDLFNMYYHLLTDNDLILADGFPRTIPQMYYFLSKECKYKREFLGVYFDIPREKAVERILSRAKIQNRIDDLNMDTINQRLDLFEEETYPVIAYFKSIGKLITIDAQQTVEEIFAQTKQAILAKKHSGFFILYHKKKKRQVYNFPKKRKKQKNKKNGLYLS